MDLFSLWVTSFSSLFFLWASNSWHFLAVPLISPLLLCLLIDTLDLHKDPILLYSLQCYTVKYRKKQPLVEDAHTWQCMPDIWTNLHKLDMQTHVLIFEISQLAGLCGGHSLYMNVNLFFFPWFFCHVVHSLSHVQIFVAPWTATCQAFLSFTVPQSLLKFISIESVMPFNHLILCWPLLLLPSIFPCIRVFSNKSARPIRWLKYWSLSIRSSNEYSLLISFNTLSRFVLAFLPRGKHLLIL